MIGGGEGDGDVGGVRSGEGVGGDPVAGGDGDFGGVAVDEGVVAERGEDGSAVGAPEAAEGGEVEVVVVVVGEEDRVDGREMVEGDAGWVVAFGAGEGERAGALGKDGVDEEVVAGDLQEGGGVADVADAEGFGAGGWGRRDGGGDEVGPGGGFGREPPAEDVGEGFVGGGQAGVEEEGAVEVV